MMSSVREDRLHAAIAFGGVCSQVRTCEKAMASGCTNLSTRAFTMAQGCQFTLSLGILNSIRNAVVIMHGPRLRYLRHRQPGAEQDI